MLNKKRTRIILSIILAVVLWAYVVGDVNPSATKTIRNIPISIYHQDVLSERSLAVSNMGQGTVDIEITGSRAVINKITANDVRAYVDMASANKGDNELTLQFSFGMFNGISIKKQSLTSTVVTVEDMVEKEVDIEIIYTGAFGDDEEGDIISMGASKVAVSGAASLVELVKCARGTIDSSRLSNSENMIVCKLQAVNETGDTVRNMMLSMDSVTVTAVMAKIKTVKMTVEVTDNSSDGAYRTVECPEEIIITGSAERLAGITSIAAKTLDISNLEDDTEIALEFDLPDGVRISGRNAEPVAKVSVSNTAERIFTFTSDDVEWLNGSGEYTYSIEGGGVVKVIVRDKPALIDGLSKSDITVSIDVSGLTPGSHSAAVSVRCSVTISSVAAEPRTVTVVVEK